MRTEIPVSQKALRLLRPGSHFGFIAYSYKPLRRNCLKNEKLLLTKAAVFDIISLADERNAGVAQLVEQLICNQQVGGSNPSTSSKIAYGGVPEWPKGTDCKSAGDAFGGSNPPSSTTKEPFLVTKSALCVFLDIRRWRNRLSESSILRFPCFPVLTHF